MKSTLSYLISITILTFMFTACSKQPAQEINAAKSAVDTVISEGAEKYASEDAKKMNADLTAAMDEIKTQDGKFMKNYDKAKGMLAKVKADAETLKAGLAVKKEEAKKNAIASQEAAKAAIDEAKSLLSKAPKGKGSSADIEAMKADIKGIEEAFPDVQKLIDAEDYVAASDKANAMKDKASEISGQIKQAIEKVGAPKAAKKK